MNKQLQKMNLIDLLSEKHLALRKIVTDKDPDQINKTESHILAVLASTKNVIDLRNQ